MIISRRIIPKVTNTEGKVGAHFHQIIYISTSQHLLWVSGRTWGSYVIFFILLAHIHCCLIVTTRTFTWGCVMSNPNNEYIYDFQFSTCSELLVVTFQYHCSSFWLYQCPWKDQSGDIRWVITVLFCFFSVMLKHAITGSGTNSKTSVMPLLLRAHLHTSDTVWWLLRDYK